MKVTLEVPLRNEGKQNKSIKLETDTATGEVEINIPAIWGSPKVDLSTLKARVDELSSLRAQHG